jgi:hypothetical protein
VYEPAANPATPAVASGYMNEKRWASWLPRENPKSSTRGWNSRPVLAGSASISALSRGWSSPSRRTCSGSR